MSEEFRKKMRTYWAKISQKLDQKLSVIRTEYDRLDAEERISIRNWVEQIADIEGPRTSLFVKARIPILPNEEEDVYVSP